MSTPSTCGCYNHQVLLFIHAEEYQFAKPFIEHIMHSTNNNNDNDESGENVALEFISSYTLSSFRIKMDKWQQMLDNSEYQAILLDWMNNDKHQTLNISLNTNGILMPAASISEMFFTNVGLGPNNQNLVNLMKGQFLMSKTLLSTLPQSKTFASGNVESTVSHGPTYGKCIYFIKQQLNCSPKMGQFFRNNVIYGDFPLHNVLDNLAFFIEEIIQPLLVQNSSNRQLWPVLVNHDLDTSIRFINTTLTEIRSKLKNQTILSLNSALDVIRNQMELRKNGELQVINMEPSARTLLEEITIDWIVKINNSIKQTTDYSTKFKSKRKNIFNVSLPMHEIQFWLNRQYNLENLYDQLGKPTHAEVISTLKEISSKYYPVFVKVHQQLSDALEVARDNTLWLHPLHLHTSAFSSIEFINADKLIVPLIHFLHLIWKNSTYYRSENARMTLLLQCCYNFMVHRAEADLHLSNLFNSDAEESLQKISKTLQTLQSFRDLVITYRETYWITGPSANTSDLEKPLCAWHFSESEIFKCTMEQFLNELLQLQQIFDAVTSFSQLEKVEVSGYRGKTLTKHIKQLYMEFMATFEKLCQWKAYTKRCNPDSRPQQLYDENGGFFYHLRNLEKSLSNILIQAYFDCQDWEHLSKLTLMFHNILQRSTIHKELRPILTHIFATYEKELQVIEQSSQKTLQLLEELDCIRDIRRVFEQYYNYPIIAGTLIWLENHAKKCHELEKPEMKAIIDLVMGPNKDLTVKYESLKTRVNDLVSKLQNLKVKILRKWSETIEEDLEVNLRTQIWTFCYEIPNESINTQKGKIKKLNINSAPELFECLLEVKYLIALQYISTITKKTITVPQGLPELKEQLPSSLVNLYEHIDELWQYKIKVLKTAHYYNIIQEKIHFDIKLKLIKSQVDCIDNCVTKAVEHITWHHYGDEFIDEILLKCHELYHTIETAQNNLELILSNIKCWTAKPLHQRTLLGNKKFLSIRDPKERCKLRLVQCEESTLFLEKLLNKNFQLFFLKSNKSNSENAKKEVEEDDTFHEVLLNLNEEQKQHLYNYLENVSEMICQEVTEGMRVSLQYLLDEIKTNKMNVFEKQSNMKIAENALTQVLKKPENIKKQKMELEVLVASEAPSLPIKPFPMASRMVTPTKQQQILFDVQLHLNNEEICFEPSLEDHVEYNFQHIFEALFHDILYTSIYFLQLIDEQVFSKYADIHKKTLCQPNQLIDLIQMIRDENQNLMDNIDMNNVQQLMDDIRANIHKTINAAKSFATELNVYSHLWIENCNNIPNDNSYSIDFNQKCTPRQVVDAIKLTIDKYNDIHDNISDLAEEQCSNDWLIINIKPFKYALLNLTCKWINFYKKRLHRYVKRVLQKFSNFLCNGIDLLQLNIKRDDLCTLLKMLDTITQIREREGQADNLFKASKDAVTLLKTHGLNISANILQQVNQLSKQWHQLKIIAITKLEILQENKRYQQEEISASIHLYISYIHSFYKRFQRLPIPCPNIYALCDKICAQLHRYLTIETNIIYCAKLLDIETPKFKIIQMCETQLKNIKHLWDFVNVFESRVDHWQSSSWLQLNTDEIESDCKQFSRDLRSLDKSVREWLPYHHVMSLVKDMNSSIRLINELQNPALKEHHWIELMQTIKLNKMHSMDYLLSLKQDPNTKLHQLLSLDLHKYEEDIKNALDGAVKEMAVTKILDEVEATWSNMEFTTDTHYRRSEVQLLKISTEFMEILDDNQMQLQNIAASNHGDHILNKLQHWQMVLSKMDSFINIWFEVQQKWCYLEKIFIGSFDIRNQLQKEAAHFQEIDETFMQLLNEVITTRKAICVILEHQHIFVVLNDLQQRLLQSEKALYTYLESKRLAFPRFYFISSTDLLDILSNGNIPQTMDRHLIKLFDSILRLSYKEDHSSHAIAMISKENNECVRFMSDYIDCSGKVELWLEILNKEMRNTLHDLFKSALQAITAEYIREIWIFKWPAQVALCCSQICWTMEVNTAFAMLESGYETAMKDLHRRQINQLNILINLLLGELSSGDRQKVMTICTIDVHSRDVVNKIIANGITNPWTFSWQSQLRHRWDKVVTTKTDNNVPLSSGDFEEDCFANICDAEFQYAYEYLGNSTRLVITPLTDRCYITLTQSLHLVMGGAPAGPAGTGKTETTKDLGRALGVMVYVFNCSEQMDYKSCANIYKGLAQTGAWGCFDEFNRICVEVLSVIAVQVKTIQEAIKMHKTFFMFMGETIKLVPSVGIFITMNPGYAGRTELPENLKALFRPCAMIVPDIALICEIMLMAEGFQDARRLARKFVTLYTLCKELLSKQDHYDWGLRAIKSVLVVAGSLKRNDRCRPEEQVLMRALRDFNIPKIVTEDIVIFTDLIGDLFPAIDVPRKRSLIFEKAIRRAIVALSLQPEEGFLIKIVQLEELLNVRHSVFIVGNAGTGKTKIWQTLLETYRIQKLQPIVNILNPKALTNDELFGTVNATTREWKDGLFSFIIREQSNLLNDNPKWIVLDGDIDPLWIESLNTLMDDNKILTLANNERITLQKTMRLLFEVGHLRAATPATVSRAGVLYINPQDLSWSPYVLSWLEKRNNLIERSILNTLFERYYPKLMLYQKELRRIIPITDISLIQTSCHLLECLLDELADNQQSNEEASLIAKSNSTHFHTGSVDNFQLNLTLIFIYATMWGFGSTLHEDHVISWRHEFHKWWINEFKDIKLPTQGTIFDYYLNVRTQKFIPWRDMASQIQLECLDIDKPLQETTIKTTETVRLTYFLKLLINGNLPCMLLGTTGCGKSTILRTLFKNFNNPQGIKNQRYNNMSTLNAMVQTSQLNYYTTSESLQKTLERSLEKKSGKWYGPVGSKNRLIYFIRDFNMSKMDAYGTIRSHTIIRQFMDYQQWYDRQHLYLKNIRNCQFAVCMNPTSGSFTIDPRLQRHFCAFSLVEPNEETLLYIYGSILQLHLENPINNFTKDIKLIGNQLVKVSINFHKRVKSLFLPTALKFHYTFNMRDLTNIYQNVVKSIGTMNSASAASTSAASATALTNFNGTICSKPSDLIRLYVHEAFRVYHDRLIEQCDKKSFKSAIRDFFKKDIEELDDDYVFSEPLIYCHFSQSLGDQKYMPITHWKCLYDLVTEAQINYNDVIGHLNLVLFEDALNHLCRINRILESPSSNALLVGVGGSGKQTLTRLASFISSMSVYQIQIKRNFGCQEMKDEISELYVKVGLKNVASVLLISDAHIPEESILTYINDYLASGEIPDLFNDDQVENITNAIRNEVKQHGIQDTKENSWRFFVEKVKRLLKIVLCFSPVGKNFRSRARKFPAIINNTCINWFHEWPNTALESVSQNFLKEISKEILPRPIIQPISYFMAFVHESVNQISTVYKQNERRFNYTTPKTFLEYIFLYCKLLIEKTDEHRERIIRLKNGMAKLAECSQQVQNLKTQLAEQHTQLRAKNEATDKLIVVVTAENDRVKNEKNIAHEEERRVRIIEEDVSIKTKVCEEDLRRAEPALIAAQAALNTLNKGNLTELKSFGSPPKAVVNVCSAVMVLLAIDGKIPHDRSWKAAKLMMARIDQFLNDLINYNKENIHENVIDELQDYLQDPEFNPDKIVQKSVAAAGLCAWVINIYRYHQIFLLVGPKQKALKDSQEELRDARRRLHYLQLKITNLEKKLHHIQAELEQAVIAKQKCQMEADRTTFTIETAHRLVNGLANENVRWKECVESLITSLSTLPGDILLISSFLSYAGCFTRRYRKELQGKLWMPYFKNIQPPILHTDVDDHISLLTDDAQIAAWNNDGLPMDRMSMENATILQNSTRWPLMIDPQLQGIKWIKNSYGKSLLVLQLTQKNFLEKLETAICSGNTVLIENIEEKIDTVLDPLLSRLLIKRNRYIRIADKELEYNMKFRLILHTKLPNPHYKPELQAQTTLINFTVTPDGLEEQLLAEVVKIERPDLEDMKSKLTVQQNKFKITLKELENELLARLASAGENILDDHDLVRNLESTKHTVNEIELKVNEARATAMQIDDARNLYRPAARRASELYFVLVDLGQINPMYKFSLKSYLHVFKQAVSLTSPDSRQEKRVTLLVNSITLQTFHYTLRALFEVDKLTFIAHMTLRLIASSKPMCRQEVDFLLRFPCDYSSVPPVDFVNRVSWAGIKSLALLEEFCGIDKDIESYPKLWKKFITSDTPESEQIPGEWKNCTALQRLCILRTLRPDRVSNAFRYFVEQTLGNEYTDTKSCTFCDIFKDITPNVPVLFVLSPGVDPIKDVEEMANKLGFNTGTDSLMNISLGQGQEILAEQAIALALKTHRTWVILQNIHLVKNWLSTLDKEIERISDANIPHTSNFRLFLTAEPAPDPKYHLIPQGILESSLKIINEPPSGLKENLQKAWNNFSEETLETCTQEAEFKSILFSLCFFHAVISQRHKFGPLGWNKTYPFNLGDLTISASVLHNYLESSTRIPWEDLRYLFGEIMYGGHITNDWDRRLCHTYLEEFLQQDLIDTEFELCPGFYAPPNLDFVGYHNYITDMLPKESPALYGLHPNAEISFLTNTSERMLKTVLQLQPRDSELSAICGTPREELVKIIAEDFLEKLKDDFNLQTLLTRIECKTPFVVVALQESERMNMLIHKMKHSLHGLIQGLKGELTLTTEMERLDNALFYDHVPECWMALAYPSVLNLQSWFTDLLHRIKELSLWVNDFKLPSSIWLGSLFNPQSFLTAIMQESARKRNLPLDRLRLHSDVTKTTYESISLPPVEGAFVHGLYLEGASWSTQLNSIVSLQSKELFCPMPVIYLKSVVQEKDDVANTFECPLYKTRFRNETFVWSFHLKSSEKPSKWILGGVALLLQP